jgi:hypothetical protein
MPYSIGDWVQLSLYPASTPMLVVSKFADGGLLCSKSEYGGDWKIVNHQLVKRVHLEPEEALSLLAGYNGWFYNHKVLRRSFQETLVVALKNKY